MVAPGADGCIDPLGERTIEHGPSYASDPGSPEDERAARLGINWIETKIVQPEPGCVIKTKMDSCFIGLTPSLRRFITRCVQSFLRLRLFKRAASSLLKNRGFSVWAVILENSP